MSENDKTDYEYPIGRDKLTEGTIKAICEKVSSGVPFKYAAQACGCSERVFHDWKKKAIAVETKIKRMRDDRTEEEGEDDHSIEESLTQREKLLLRFLQSIKVAKSKSIERNVALINVAANESWQAAAWWLERAVPEEFSRRDKHDLNHSGKIDSELTIAAKEIGKMTEEEQLEHADSLRDTMSSIANFNKSTQERDE